MKLRAIKSHFNQSSGINCGIFVANVEGGGGFVGGTSSWTAGEKYKYIWADSFQHIYWQINDKTWSWQQLHKYLHVYAIHIFVGCIHTWGFITQFWYVLHTDILSLDTGFDIKLYSNPTIMQIARIRGVFQSGSENCKIQQCGAFRLRATHNLFYSSYTST